jgi:hypothetical protein
LFTTLGVRESFQVTDYVNVLKKMQQEFNDQPLSAGNRIVQLEVTNVFFQTLKGEI